MNRSVQERAILPDLKDPVLISAFATPTKGGSTAASALSYLAKQWKAQPVTEFGAERLYSYGRIPPQLVSAENGERTLQWPTNTVFLAQPEGIDRSFLLLIGVEPSMGWQEFIETIQGFCRRNNIETAITLHSMPANVSHRLEAPVMGVYGSQEMQASFGLPATVFQDGPINFAAVLSLNLNASGLHTADLIVLEPFYTPGLPDASAALSLVAALDHYFGTRTSVESLAQMANEQRESYEEAIASAPHLSALAEQLEHQTNAPPLLNARGGEELSVSTVMDEVDRILGS
jgi:predicted ATP-grasp superfamily ATP-dependent carboligase